MTAESLIFEAVIVPHRSLSRRGLWRLLAAIAAVCTLNATVAIHIGAWPVGLTSRSLADFATEIIRLTQAVGPGHVAIGTDLDGNYQPVLTSYDQLSDLTRLLHDRGLTAAQIRQSLGGNAADLLNRTGP